MNIRPLTPTLLRSIRQTLEAGRLLDALAQMQGNIQPQDALYARVEEIRTDYEFLLSYIRQGIADPTRHKQYADFFRRAYEIYDRLALQQRRAAFESIRTRRETPDTVPADTSSRPSFEDIVLSDKWGDAESLYIDGLVSQMGTDDADADAQIVSAITLALLNVFDEEKFNALLKFYFHRTTGVFKARAMVGLIFALLVHEKRLALYPRIAEQTQRLLADEYFSQHLDSVQYQLIQSLRTQADIEAINEELVPWLQRQQQHLSEFLQTNDDVELHVEEVNPLWTDENTRSEMEEALNNLMEYMRKGTDTFYQTFAQIHRMIPFFEKAGNWFLPFSSDSPQLPQTGRDLSALNMLFDMQHFSNQARWAMTFFILRLPENHLSTILSSFPSDADIRSKDFEITEEEEAQRFLQSYLHDLYRFFTLYAHRNLFCNPYEQSLHLIESDIFKSHFNSIDKLRTFSDLYIKNKDWENALKYLNLIAPADYLSRDLEQMGFCREKLGQQQEALIHYEQALMLEPDSVWTQNRLALLHYEMGNYARALQLFNDLLEQHPERNDLLVHVGACQMKLQQYEAAENTLAKADFLLDNMDTKRARGWLRLLTRRYEEASTTFRQITASDAQASDFRQLGHALLLSGKVDEATQAYTQYMLFDPKHPLPAHKIFEEERDTLLAHGLSDEFLRQIADLVRISQPKTDR